MTISSARLLVVYPDTQDTELRWPVAQPSDVLDYALDLSALLPSDDEIISASVAIAPSGTGEAQPSDLNVSIDSVLSVWIAGGYPTRRYDIKVQCQTVHGREIELGVVLMISSFFSTTTPPDPQSSGYGTPVTWTISAFDFSNVANSGYIALLAGL